jgi:N-carbamoyl-L-amino-acid hydrolase
MSLPQQRAAETGDGGGRALAEALFDELRVKTGDGIGITRASYGDGESVALDIVEAEARALEFTTERDAGANLVVTYAGSEPDLPCLACGSHLDSVPQGGNFDGGAGVIAGLAVLASLKHDSFRPRRTLKLYALRGEDSAHFGKAYVGAGA